MEIVSGRHPLLIAYGSNNIIPNDVSITRSIYLLSGANMGKRKLFVVLMHYFSHKKKYYLCRDEFNMAHFLGGKSTVMRQTGLLVVLAQLGCKVPAKAMKLRVRNQIASTKQQKIILYTYACHNTLGCGQIIDEDGC